MIYILLFIEFFKMGLFTFGGGYAMIPLMKETVLNHQWIDESCFYDFIGVCESTPGPIAINMATFVGSKYGVFGSFCATLGVVLPSFIIILLIAIIFKNILKSQAFRKIIEGIKPVVMGLILSTGLLLFVKVIGYNEHIFSFNIVSTFVFVIIATLYLLIKKIYNKKIPPILLILISSILGIFLSIIIK